MLFSILVFRGPFQYNNTVLFLTVILNTVGHCHLCVMEIVFTEYGGEHLCLKNLI